MQGKDLPCGFVRGFGKEKRKKGKGESGKRRFFVLKFTGKGKRGEGDSEGGGEVFISGGGGGKRT